MSRVALYARYSSDQQSAASIDDQLRICREQAARDGWHVVGTYKDAAISGSSITLRPGIQQLLQDAQARRFDVILAEALDRVSRDQADVATLYKHLQFVGVTLVTLAEGEISELHVGLKGTMNALFLKDLARKTHRGMRGRVEKGKAGGGLCYGYDVVRRLDGDGEPIRGERTINEAQAAIVRRIFRDYANGVSPQAIALRLNAEGVPGPDGGLWTGGTLRGHAKRGTGLLNNELYIGRLVWNRQRYVKDPRSGRRVSRINPESEWIVTEVPELRVVDDALWQAAKTRQDTIQIQYAASITGVHHAIAMRSTVRPKSLLSGLLHCGVCGGPYSLRGQGRFACSTHTDTRTCDNGHTIARTAIEERILAGLKDRLMAPEIVAEAVRACVEETNRLNRVRRDVWSEGSAELAAIDKASKDIVTAIENGCYSDKLRDRLLEMEARETVLKRCMAEGPANVPDVHPNIAELYARKVARLTEALKRPEDRDEAADAIRGLIERVTLTPGEKRGEVHATLHGEFGSLLAWVGAAKDAGHDDAPGSGEAGALGMSVKMVAGTGFEPVTFRL